ncbi:MAG: ABC transporter permease [Gaiellales bacterium]
MIGIVAALTIRQMFSRARTILIGLIALLPIGLAFLYRADRGTDSPEEWATGLLFEVLVASTLLPLAALINGTAALGAEIEDGTAVYLLAKPVPRSRIVLGKLLGAWVATVAVMIPSVLGAAIVAAGGLGEARVVPGLALALAVGSLVYCALFLMVSIHTSRALIGGLVYVFVWEGLINGFFGGTRLLSVRHYTLAIADGIIDLPRFAFHAKLGFATAVVAAVVVTVAATWQAIRRLQRFEIGETA